MLRCQEEVLCPGKGEDTKDGKTQEEHSDYSESNPHTACLETLTDCHQQQHRRKRHCHPHIFIGMLPSTVPLGILSKLVQSSRLSGLL